MRRRSDDKDKRYFRSERLFLMNGQWYFSTREADCGPYVTPEAARRALAQYVNEKVELGGFQTAREREVHKPKQTLAERLKVGDLAPTFDRQELLI